MRIQPKYPIVRMTKSNLNQINKADIPKLFLQEVELANGYDSPTDLLLEIRERQTLTSDELFDIQGIIDSEIFDITMNQKWPLA